MGVNGIADGAQIAAVADTAHHVDDVKAHWRSANIHRPGFILPADGDACAIVGLMGVAATRRFVAGPPFWIVGPVIVIK